MEAQSTPLRNFLEISYDQLEQMNLQAREKSVRVEDKELEAEYRLYLNKEPRLKAVTLCFSDIEGRFHMLDYDKKYLLESGHNLTFDGSSVRGFSMQRESDLRLKVDWASFRFLPADVFGPGKVIAFADVLNRDWTPYSSDFRSRLKQYSQELRKKQGPTAYVAAEIEGFLVEGLNAEQNYEEDKGFKLVSTGGYYHSLPLDRLRRFIDVVAEAQRAMGFRNEKDHPEVAPSQFELNFAHTDALQACDLIQLYKLVCRQVAANFGNTATFLPKPMVGINGSGMHLNISLGKGGQNLFYDADGKEGLSKLAWEFTSRLLNHAPEICLALNSSVNAYRRLDPHFEAPNQIKVSPIDRGAMIRIPAADKKSSRIEVRSVGPDANPYLAVYSILATGLAGTKLPGSSGHRARVRLLPDNLNDAVRFFKSSDLLNRVLGPENKEKFVHFKEMAADRSPKELGKIIKKSEIIYHHEVTNQSLWSSF